MKALFDNISDKTSRMMTNVYSTSFSLGVRLLAPRFQQPVHAIYGFVRLADEIVDTFHDFDKVQLLADFRNDTRKAISQGISLNPVLNSFQKVVHQYGINDWMIDTFLKSMEMDLTRQTYNKHLYDEYIIGSAEVVGLMCLKVFVEGDEDKYNHLEVYARKLGSAFQKINFLRDLKNDTEVLGRMYFPELNAGSFNETSRLAIEEDIRMDFEAGFEGIRQLPKDARLGVYIAYIYYNSLFNKIRKMPVNRILAERIRIPDQEKYALLFGSYLRHSFNLL